MSSPLARDLKYAPVAAGWIEIEIQRVSRQVQVHNVGSFDAKGSGISGSDPRDLDLLFDDRDIQLLGLFENGIAHRVIALGAVGA